MNHKFRLKKTTTGHLRTPVVFYRYESSNSPEPTENEILEAHKCLAEVYSPSMKDIELMKVTDTKNAMTIVIRDTKGEYLPVNNDYVEILDYRYPEKRWNILDVRYDLTDNNFITILLGDSYVR